MRSLLDIRIGTLVGIQDAVRVVPQLVEHGFESFQLTGGFGVDLVDFADIAPRVREAIEGRAVISSLGYFGNPLQHPHQAEVIRAYLDAAKLFGCDTWIGFAGALDGQPVMDSMPAFKKIWTDLAKHAADQGVKIAFENCEMGGFWHSAKWNIAHSPTFFEAMWNEIPSDNVGICWEPCHQMVSLIDPIPQLRKYAAARKIFTVHGKDASIAWDVIREKGIRGGVPYVWHRHPGFGDTNWTDVISILRMNDYKGSIDIEGWHDPVYREELELTGQIHAMHYLKRCRGGMIEIPNPR